MNIRFAKREDLNQIIDLCEAHAAYEKCDYDKKGKAAPLAKDLFGSQPKLYCLVVEKDETLIGYATYMTQYATWDACEYIYMDTLYITQSERGQNIGEKLVVRIKEEGLKLNCHIIQWQTPEFNHRAIKFYKRIGATSKSKERFFLEM